MGERGVNDRASGGFVVGFLYIDMTKARKATIDVWRLSWLRDFRVVTNDFGFDDSQPVVRRHALGGGMAIIAYIFYLTPAKKH